MAQLILKANIVAQIKDNTVLFGKVAEALGFTIRQLLDALPKNEPRLATASVLQVLKDELKVAQDSDLLTKMQAPKSKKVSTAA